ncbi:MAG: HEAT repeat domain-containing protein [Deltaproteobacteria bacterium]|nr:HEAT repeat domain-containing protein [Deltaproteobacteria bacterium]
MTVPEAVRALERPAEARDWPELVAGLAVALGDEIRACELPPADSDTGEAVSVTQRIARGLGASRLLLIVRAGTLPERREAARRLGDMLAGRVDPGDVSRPKIVVGLEGAWDPEIAYEIARALGSAGGAVGRDATATASRTQLLVVDLERGIERYWNGEDVVDPILALLPEERTLVGVFCRDMPDLVVSHSSELLVHLLRTGAIAPLREVTFALIPAADARLIPALVRILEDGTGSVRLAAARALARIDDPRAPAALARALERETEPEARTVFGGSLALASGDRRAATELRDALASPESVVVEAALEGLAAAGAQEDVRSVCARLGRPEPAIAVAAAWTLARIGDAAALPDLESALSDAVLPAVKVALAGASDRVRARAELAGERGLAIRAEPSARPLAVRGPSPDSGTAPPGPSIWSRTRARVRDLFGRFFSSLGLHRAAARHFARAAALDPGAGATLLGEGCSRLRLGDHGEAMIAFRRALSRDPAAVQRRRAALADLVRVYLRESTRLEDASHRVEARQTLDELLALDLSAAPLPLRLEVARRREVLRRT